ARGEVGTPRPTASPNRAAVQSFAKDSGFMPSSLVSSLEKGSLRSDGKLFADSMGVDLQRKMTGHKHNRPTSSRQLRHPTEPAKLQRAKDRDFSNEASRGCREMLCCRWAIQRLATCNQCPAALAAK